MRIIITCGPSYEPIDRVRRLTNFSTGRLGVTLANFWADAGHEVVCLKGEGSTYAGAMRALQVETFATNDDLVRLLETRSGKEPVDAVLHAAALCDYRVDHVQSTTGDVITSPKFATRDGRLHLVLVPATKILPRIRTWFPTARIVGWKYELAGTQADAFARAWKQIEENSTDACVLNGASYGPGFAFCQPDGRVETCADADALCATIGNWLKCPQPVALRSAGGCG